MYLQKLETLSGAGERDYKHEESVGKWVISSHQSGDWNNNKYSKTWHRSHGGVFEISTRKLFFKKPHGRGFIKKEVELKSWQGDFVAKAVIELGLAPKKSKYSMKIRINKAFDAIFLYERRGYKFYSRTILGEHADYVIESPLGMIYHDEDKSKLIQGLHKKIRNAARKLQGIISWNKCKTLGFCDSGIKEFCNVFGFSTAGQYTLTEIEKAVRKNINAAEPFIPELKILSSAFNKNVLEFN